jgi:hypothetical protein
MGGIEILEGFWRESARPLRLFIFSAYAVVPLVLFILHIKYWTLGLLVATFVGLWYIERKGFTIPVAVLALRAAIAGKVITRQRMVFAKRLNR